MLGGDGRMGSAEGLWVGGGTGKEGGVGKERYDREGNGGGKWRRERRKEDSP